MAVEPVLWVFLKIIKGRVRAGKIQLVQEALGEERVLGITDRAPVPGGNGQLGRRVLDLDVRNR